MRRLIQFVLVFSCGGLVGWMIADRNPPVGTGYPSHIEIRQPHSTAPGKISTFYKLQVVSANEDGWPVAVSEGREGQPTWAVKIVGGSKPMMLFVQEE